VISGAPSNNSNVDGTGFTVLRAFSENTDGAQPSAAPIQGIDGRLYGTADGGGAYAGGTIYATAPDGTGFAVLHAFIFENEGAGLFGGVIQGTDGRLYGTTEEGGEANGGTIYAIAPDGTGFTVLHAFNPSTEGDFAVTSLIQGTDGRLYGMTSIGGVNGEGTIFAMATDGTGFTLLRSFTPATDGAYPDGGLVQGADGRLYGTTSAGGANSDGTIFAIAADGAGFTVLHSLAPATDGVGARATLTQGTDGKLYGTTAEGGADDAGTIFAVATDGTDFTVLHSFTPATDGANDYSGLIQGADGMLYGTTALGGANDGGTIFAIARDGTGFDVLYAFTMATDGATPGGLVQGSDGGLYGTTRTGGANGEGTLFNYSYFLSSPGPRLVNVSTRAQVGTGANILIPGFVVAGNGTETLLIRADGPSLTRYGVTGVLAQPSLTVVDSAGNVIASNTGWGTNATPSKIASVAAQVGAFAFATGSADSAVIVYLPAGGYTVEISGVNNTTGVALGEVYEVSSTGTRLTNISTRAQVGTGANIMIPGFVVTGAGTEQLLVRGDGPSLTQYGVSGVLEQPSLDVFSGHTIIASNTVWSTSTSPAPAQIASVAAQVGAFSFTSGSADSAQVVNLAAGSYTMQIRGVNNSTGVALAEVYEVP
jgi:uncharacterized repeat protein (TIGR03803 family)